MTLNEYQALAARTISCKTRKDMTLHSLHGMAAELGELHGIYQKVYQGHVEDYMHMKKEAGDLLWMLAEYCTANGWDLDEIANINIDKLRQRYPNGFETARSLNRATGDI